MRGPFVVQAFGAHMATIRGSLDLHDLIHSSLLGNEKSIGAVGLSAVAVSSVYTYHILLNPLF